MFELRVIESGYRSDQRGRHSFYVRVAGIGADGFIANLIVVELYLEGFLDFGDRASRSHVEIVGTRLYYVQIVGGKKLLNGLRFLRRGRELRGDIFLRQPMMIARGTAVIERLS